MNDWKSESQRNDAQFTLSSLPFAGHLATLDDLLLHAEKLAGFSMKNVGYLEPALFMLGSDGPQMLTPSSLADDRAKDGFAMVARTICVAKAVTAAVLVSEAWVATAKAGKSLNINQRPSESPDRQEVVVLMGEDRNGTRQKMLPILRSPVGEFSGFGFLDPMKVDAVQGRFAQFLKPAMPSAQERASANAFLRSTSSAPGPRQTTARPPRFRM